jgi:hypothetical protein
VPQEPLVLSSAEERWSEMPEARQFKSVRTNHASVVQSEGHHASNVDKVRVRILPGVLMIP